MELPGGSAAKLLAFADQLDGAASGTTGLASSTREAMESTPSWTGDAARPQHNLLSREPGATEWMTNLIH
jgi:hypothetical protein